MTDIGDRDDILLIMRSFYDKLLSDRSISYLFTDVVKINLEEHFPILVDFWDGILFGTGTYRKNAMQPHIDLAHKSPLTREHFVTWHIPP
ncbi:group III truncated hemoglobin [Bacteroidia bacterium]|nr:group III truncated hemoglobin [Bacteroidia bacterium]